MTYSIIGNYRYRLLQRLPITSKGEKEMSNRGILIAVEGMDGSGKSTQAKLLYHWLRAKGLPVYHTEWNSSKIVRQATKLGKNNRRLLPSTFHLIHAADFADRWAQQIEPVLKIGGIVICDRYKYTAMARDGSRGVPLESIETTYSFAREPDLTIYFDVPVDVSYDRIANGRPTLKYYEAGMDMNWSNDPFESYRIFQEKVSEIYDELVKNERILRLDATGTVPEVQKRTRKIFEENIDLSNVEVIDYADRLAENLSQSEIDWLSYKEVVE
ncbi:MAG: dTMP kinase [Candidatus Thalassarchaeaceae archaeon]|nr:dTMP kinase [Candidatus Thalassarchaeaceae archaeon]